MTLNFDFGITGINSLLRLNRNTGTVDTINTGFSDGGNTVFTSLGNGKYQLQLKLDGGTGDLFKYNDGTAFVGVQTAAALGVLGRRRQCGEQRRRERRWAGRQRHVG